MFVWGVRVCMDTKDSEYSVVSLADRRQDLESGGQKGARAMEHIAKYLRESLSESVSVHINYEADEGVDMDGDRMFERDLESVRDIELVAQSFSELDPEVLRKVHLSTGLTAETEYDDSGIGANVFRYRLTK